LDHQHPVRHRKPVLLEKRGHFILEALNDVIGSLDPFLTFVLQVPAHKNALILEIKGPEGAKRLIRAELLVD
jgi:hypothetical protein